MSDTYKKIKVDIITAMKAKDKKLTTILRGLDGAIQLRAKNERVDVDENITLGVIEKGIKQRLESIDAYTKGNRPDLLVVEQEEMDVYKSYLPEQLTESDLIAIIDAAIAQVGATVVKDMGAVNKIVMPQVKGRADGKRVSEIVKGKLS